MPANRLVDDIRSAVSPSIYSRGRLYFLEGRVASITEKEGRLVAVVDGTHRYTVTFSAGDASTMKCDCPFEGACKHMVAVALQSSEGAAASDPADVNDAEEAIERLTKLSEAIRRKADMDALLVRAGNLIASLEPLDPEKRESILRKGVDTTPSGPLSTIFFDAWLDEILSTPAGSIGPLIELLDKDPYLALDVISRALFTEEDAEALVQAIPASNDPGLDPLTLTARIHLLGIAGRMDDVAQTASPDMPVEALEKACRILSDAGRGQLCAEILESALEGRTLREEFVLRSVLSEVHHSNGDPELEAEQLMACLAIRFDPAMLDRILEVDPLRVLDLIKSLGPEDQITLGEALNGADRPEIAHDLVMRTTEPEIAEWLMEELEIDDITAIRHLIALLLTAKGRDVYWRVRRWMEAGSELDGYSDLVAELREAYPDRPALLRLLDEVGG